MRSNVRLLLSRIGQQRQSYSLVALHSPSYVRFYTSHNPSEEQHGVWNGLKNCLSWIKNKQEVRIIVPEAEAYVIERDGKYIKTLTSGLHSLVATHDKVAHVHSLKEETISIPHWPTMTTDGFDMSIDGSLSVKIVDPKLASYAINEPMHNVIELAQTTMGVMIKQMTLGETFEKRDTLNERILMGIHEYAKNWGFACLRYEIRDICFIADIKETMEKLAVRLCESRAKVLALEAQSEVYNLGAHDIAEKFLQYQNA